MNKKRLPILIEVLVLSVVLISACTSSAEEKGTEEIPTVETVTEAAPTPEVITESADEQLFNAIIANDIASAKQGLDAGANPDALNSAGVSVLLSAIRGAKSGSTDIIKLLLEFGADANGTDEDGNPLLPQLARAGNVEVVQLLLDAGADVNVTMNARTPNGTILRQSPALMHATIGNHVEVVEFLIANGADLNQTDATYNDTALHAAAWINYVEIIKVLLNSGADPNPVNIYEESPTPLYYAIESDSFEAFQTLVEGGVDVDFQSKLGLTPLMKVMITRNRSDPVMEMVVILLDGGADPNVQDNSGKTALHHAARWKQSEIILLLIEHGAVLDIEDNFGQTALDIAIPLDEEIAEILREAGAGE
ncbi:MAG: hypothetical protein GY807_19295 [Gammaproteobacteria bacterium]|nr:hypothetical protein [Gammaproteobacteria bacterium]